MSLTIHNLSFLYNLWYARGLLLLATQPKLDTNVLFMNRLNYKTVSIVFSFSVHSVLSKCIYIGIYWYVMTGGDGATPDHQTAPPSHPPDTRTVRASWIYVLLRTDNSKLFVPVFRISSYFLTTISN